MRRLLSHRSETLALHKEPARRLAELERKIERHDGSIRTLFQAICGLAAPPNKPRREIGFHVNAGAVFYRVPRNHPPQRHHG